MPRDLKYGRVELPDADFSDVGEDEPVVVFRAKDALLVDVLDFYARRCIESGAPGRHVELVERSGREVAAWQRKHGARTPSSAGYFAQEGT